MDVNVELDRNKEAVELDNGHQYFTMSVNDAQQVVKQLIKLLADHNLEKNQKDPNFYGGL